MWAEFRESLAVCRIFHDLANLQMGVGFSSIGKKDEKKIQTFLFAAAIQGRRFICGKFTSDVTQWQQKEINDKKRKILIDFSIFPQNINNDSNFLWLFFYSLLNFFPTSCHTLLIFVSFCDEVSFFLLLLSTSKLRTMKVKLTISSLFSLQLIHSLICYLPLKSWLALPPKFVAEFQTKFEGNEISKQKLIL